MEVDENEEFSLFGDFLSKPIKQGTPHSRWKNELDTYRELPRPHYKIDPLFWWMSNSATLPGLGNYSLFICNYSFFSLFLFLII
jgi:hypothetical protein